MPRRNPSCMAQCLHSKPNFFFTSFCSKGYRKLSCLALLTFVFGDMPSGTHVVLAAQKLFSESASLERQSLAVADSTRAAAVRRFRNVKINPCVLNAQADAGAQQTGSNDGLALPYPVTEKLRK